MTRFGEISPLGQNFNILWDNLSIVLVWYLANFCTYFGSFYAAGQIFYDVNGQRVKNKMVIWSHCSESSESQLCNLLF